MADTFNPVKIPLADYPHPVGTIMLGSAGSTSTVVDRDGHAFLACCTSHDEQGVASGYHPQTDNGRLLDRSTPADITAYDCPFNPAAPTAN